MGRTTRRDTSPTIPRRYATRAKAPVEPATRHQTPLKVSRPEGAMGRPQIYDPERFPHIGKTLCSEYGFTHQQLSKVFGVSKLTIEDWVRKYPEFRSALKEGRDTFDTCKVENALLKSALGYEFTEVTKQSVRVRGKDAEGNKVSIPAERTITKITYVPPNVKAILFWLTNRQPERWKMLVNAKVDGKIKHEHSGTVQHLHHDLSKLDSKDLMALRDMVARQQGVIPAEFERVDGGEQQQDETVLQLDHILRNIDQYDLMGDDNENGSEGLGEDTQTEW